MSFDAEAAQQLHHVMIMFWRRITDAEYPVKQIGVGAIEQFLEPPELVAVQDLEQVLSERSENEVAFLRPAVPAAKQEAPAAEIGDVRDLLPGKGYFSSGNCSFDALLRGPSVLHPHAHRRIRRQHHVRVHICHDPHCAGDHDEYDENAKGEREYVVGAFRPGGDVQEEHQVHPHLGDGEDSEAQNTPPGQISEVLAAQKDVAVRRTARNSPVV